MMKEKKLKMLSLCEYVGVNKDDPIRFYNLPFIGKIYRRRVEKCLSELSGGVRVLEVGFGSGVTFLNLSEIYDEIYGLDLTADVESVAATFEGLGIRTFLKNGNILDLPYEDDYFDSVLLISILEHLNPESLIPALREVRRVLKRNGQVVYGVPVDKMIMNCAFRLLGYNIQEYHFSDHRRIPLAVRAVFKEVAASNIDMWPFGKLYEIGHYTKNDLPQSSKGGTCDKN